MERLLSIERLRSVLAEEQRIQRVLRQNYTYVLPELKELARIETELDVIVKRVNELSSR